MKQQRIRTHTLADTFSIFNLVRELGDKWYPDQGQLHTHTLESSGSRRLESEGLAACLATECLADWLVFGGVQDLCIKFKIIL